MFEGLLGGFSDRKAEVEERNFKLGQQASQQEASIFSALMNSDDPEVRALAITGLLDTANPRRKSKGIKGWIGETQGSPFLEDMRRLIATPQQVPNPAVGAVPAGATVPATTLPAKQSVAGVGLPAVQPSITEAEDTTGTGQPSAGMSPNAPVQGTGAPPTPVSYTTAPPTPFTVSRMRNVFLTGADRVRADKIAAAQGEIEGEKAGLVAVGYSDAQALEIIRRNMERQYAGRPQSIAGELPNGTGGWTPAFGVFTNGVYTDPDTGQPLDGFRPRTSTGSTSLGVAIEPLARLIYGKRGADLSQPEMGVVFEAAQLQKNILTTKDALSAVDRLIPNATVEQKMQLADALMLGTQSLPQPAAGAGGAVAPGAMPSAAGAPPAPSTPAAVPAGAGAGGVGAAGTGAVPGATAPVTPQAGAPPAPRSLSGAIPPNFADASKESGKPLDPTVAATLAKAEATNDLIDQALAALEPFKDDNSPDGAIALASNYRQGVYDPVATAAAQLADLAGLQNSAQASLTSGGTRAFQFYVDRRQHVPRLPSGRQTLAGGIFPGGAVQTGSVLLRGDDAGFDSPQLMYQKLLGAKENNLNFVRELKSATALRKDAIRPMPSHAPTGAPPPPAGTGTPTSGAPYLDKKTNTWIIP